MTIIRKEQAGSGETVAQENEAGSPESCETAMSFPASSIRLNRRVFIGVTTASVAALATGIVPSSIFRAVAAPKGGGAVTRNPLYIPPTVPLSNLSLLAAAPAMVDLGGGKTSSVLAYNGSLPGPTLLARPGDAAAIRLLNSLADPTITHWHGMVVPTEADGHPRFAIGPGGTYDYKFTVNANQRAALNWYHPHPHMITGEQVCLGLAGAFIINDSEETALGLPAGAYEVPLIIRDANLDSSGNLTYNPTTTGFDGKIPLVNGTRNPKLDVDTALYRFRVLNGANSRLFKLALSTGDPFTLTFTLIGNDGGLLGTPAQIGQIEFSSGERLDLLVDFRGLPVGTKVMLRDLNAGWDLLEFNVTRVLDVNNSYTVPATLSTITKLTNPVATRSFKFEGMSKINGKVYDLNYIDPNNRIPFGQIERWTFTSGRNSPHPVHVHGASFQVQSRSGGRGVVFPWEQGWKDTVLLLDGETVEVFIRFNGSDAGGDFKGESRGLYLLHCHKLEHEDMGMMMNFVVIP